MKEWLQSVQYTLLCLYNNKLKSSYEEKKKKKDTQNIYDNKLCSGSVKD